MNAFRKAVWARSALAMSRLRADPDEANMDELRAGCLAHALGWEAFRTGAPISPLLASESLLREEWENGLKDAEAIERLARVEQSLALP